MSTSVINTEAEASTSKAQLSTPEQQQQQQQLQSQSQVPTSSSGPQIRSRITVVCAECKRLKLKCDRRTPCGSCTKRDTLQRCIYSPAASEKIDLHTLNNRLIVIESHINSLNLPSPTLSSPSSVSSTVIPRSDRALIASGFSGSSIAISLEDVSSLYLEEVGITMAEPPNAHAKWPSDAGITVKIEETSSNEMQAQENSSTSTFLSSHLTQSSTSPTSCTDTAPRVTPQLLSHLPPISALEPLEHLLKLHPSGLNFRHFRERVAAMKTWFRGKEIKTSMRLEKMAGGLSVGESEMEDVTASLSGCAHDRARAHGGAEVGNNPEYVNGLTPALDSGHGGSSGVNGQTQTSGEPRAPYCLGSESVAASSSAPTRRLRAAAQTRRYQHPDPTMSLYAAAAAAFALAGLVAGDGAHDDHEVGEDETSAGDEAELGSADDVEAFLRGQIGRPERGSVRRRRGTAPSGLPSSSTAFFPVVKPPSPRQLHWLAVQALAVYERGLGGSMGMYDLDYLVAGCFSVLWGLYGGGIGRARGRSVGVAVYAEVGKMVNVARLMGLGFDPDEAPGRWTLFESEMRRRVWWDVLFYDLFVSDCMGQPPNIADNSYTTRMPADVDESAFDPRSVLLPLPGIQVALVESDTPSSVQSSEEGWHENGFKYFELKCRCVFLWHRLEVNFEHAFLSFMASRLAQLVKGVKSRTFRDSYTIDQAAKLEKEVMQWLRDLPTPFRMSMDSSDIHSVSPVLIAQRCELHITAHGLILKVYLPFMKASRSSSDSAHQAFFGTTNAAHAIINASKALYQVWTARMAAGKERKSLTPALFEFYSFGRSLFNAAVVCAHAVVQQGSAIWAKTALEATESALEIMRDPMVEGPDSEAVRVIELMYSRAREPSVGMKRTFDQIKDGGVDGSSLRPFPLPYVGPAVSSGDLRPPSSPVSQEKLHRQTKGSPRTPMRVSGLTLSAMGGKGTLDERPNLPLQKAPAEAGAAARMSSSSDDNVKGAVGKHAKRSHYPAVGMRLRSDAQSKESTTVMRSRASSTSTLATRAESRMPAPPVPPQVIAIKPPRNVSPQDATSPERSRRGRGETYVGRPRSSSTHQDACIQPLVTHHQEQEQSPTRMESSVAAVDGTRFHMSHQRTRRFSIHGPEVGQALYTSIPQQQIYENLSGSYGGVSNTYGNVSGSPSYADQTTSSPYDSTVTNTSGRQMPPDSQQFVSASGSTGRSMGSMVPSQKPSMAQPEFGQMASSSDYLVPSAYESGYDVSLTQPGMPIGGVDMRGPTQMSMGAVDMMTQPVADSPRDVQQAMYDVRDSVHASQQARYGHPPNMRHDLSMPPLHSWPTENNSGGEYWNMDYKYYSQ